MTKDVLVTVRGKQIGNNYEDEIEIINRGNCYERNGKTYIRYEEQQEESDAVIQNMIKIGSDGIEITKKGSVGAQMIFRENEKINSCYETPYGMMMMAIYTNRIQCSIEPEKIEINVLYSIEMNGELLSDADVYIKVEPLGMEQIKLM
ncbi:MAG: DUF1934 domain-containing protein [Thermoflexaceae bacterium]|nr:DUF1934 domain-containing protein [Thermoflexaceae bacterium]